MEIIKLLKEKFTILITIIGILFYFILRDKLLNFLGWVFGISLTLLGILFTLLAVLVVRDFAKEIKRDISQKTQEIQERINSSIDEEKGMNWDKNGIEKKQKLCLERMTYYTDIIYIKEEIINGMVLSFLFCILSVVLYSLLNSGVVNLNDVSSEIFTIFFVFSIFYSINYITKVTIRVFDYLKLT